jgi:hypothetical protein
VIQAGLGKKQDLLSKLRDGDMAQAGKHLPWKLCPEFKFQYHQRKVLSCVIDAYHELGTISSSEIITVNKNKSISVVTELIF